MRIDIMTLFPELIDGVMHESIIGARGKGAHRNPCDEHSGLCTRQAS